MNETMAYQPQYFRKFQCTGSECRSNCCGHNWQIRIDKNTYEKYMRLNNDEKKVFLERIKVFSQEPFIANMIEDKNGNCSFLDDKGLCSIQQKYGYNYLSRTCRIHPRNICYLDGEFETSLEFSCEEAARVILFEQNIMKFEKAILEPDGDGRVIPNRELVAKNYTSAANAVELFHKLRMTSINIIQDRQYSVRIRMLILCIFIEQINEMLASGRDSEVERFATEFIESIDAGGFNDLVEQMPEGVTLKADIVLDILTEIDTIKDKDFSKHLRNVLDGFGITLASNEIPLDFQESYAKYYEHYFHDKEYIFENYIVNHIFMDGFPFNYKNTTGGVKKNFADLLINYNLIEFLQVGICVYNIVFDEQIITDCVSAFSRKYDHSQKGYLNTEF